MIISGRVNTAAFLVQNLVRVSKGKPVIETTMSIQSLYNAGRALVKAGILGSVKGRNGHYYIAVSKVTLGDVARAIYPESDETHVCSALDSVVLFDASRDVQDGPDSIETDQATSLSNDDSESV